MGMTMEQAVNEITRAYGTLVTQHGPGLVYISDIANLVDLTNEQLHAGIKHLRRTQKWSLIPESNQKALTAENRAAAMWAGDQWKHLTGRA